MRGLLSTSENKFRYLVFVLDFWVMTKMKFYKNQKLLIIHSLMLSVLLFTTSCGNETSDKKVSNDNASSSQKYVQVSPDFNSEYAYEQIQKQLEFGPRVCNSEAHKKCGDYLVAELSKYAEKVTEQKSTVTNFDGQKIQIRNIIASFNTKATKRIFLSSHWDSRPYSDNDPNPENHNTPVDGADDGASGVAVSLEIARILSEKQPNIGVDIVLFDAEDLGKSEYENSFCLGSQYWASNLKNQNNTKYEFGVLFDMVGGANAKFVWEQTSIEYAEPILQKVWDTGIRMGYSSHFYYYKKGGIIDDHYYVNKLAGIPTIDIISYDAGTKSGFPAHWHTVNDNISVIDRNTLKAIGQTVLEVIYTEK